MRLAVVKPRNTSPLPWPIKLPKRASPTLPAPDDARELAVRERQVRGHHENAAPLIASRRILRGKDGLSAQQQIRFAAVVGQREHAEHIALPTDFHKRAKRNQYHL